MNLPWPSARITSTGRHRFRLGSKYWIAINLPPGGWAAPRPVTPAYSDISLAIQKTFHPPGEIDPKTVGEQLKDRLEKAAEGKIF